MMWVIAKKKKGTARVSPSAPRLVPTAPVDPGFNEPLEADHWEEVNSEESTQKAVPGNRALQEELDAWDAASDEALENLEDSLPE